MLNHIISPGSLCHSAQACVAGAVLVSSSVEGVPAMPSRPPPSKQGQGHRQGQQMQLIMFADEEKEPTAVCNDGSRGGYYFSSASDPNQADVFVVYLPGGGQCWDQASCATRGGTYVSSLTFPSSRTVYGILDADPAHTPLWGANKAYLGYCSSDGYMGDVGASDDTWGWAFRGQALVRALVRDLVDTHGLQTARKVYVVGSSAGGRGVMVHLDALVASPMWPATAEVIGFLDSPYYLDIEPYSEDFQGFAYQEQQKYLLFNTTGIIDADCAAVYPTEQWKCQFGQYRMPFVDTPYFLVASMYDAYQLSNNIQTEPAQYDADMLAYATAFGALDREDLSALTAAIIAPDSSRSPLSGKVRGGGRAGDGDGYGYAVYAWACYNHAVAVTSLFYEASSSEGVSQKQAFQEYLSQNPGGAGANTTTATSTTTSASGDFFVLTWMDSCEEFACDVNC